MAGKDIIGETSTLSGVKNKVYVAWRRILDKTVPHRALRWAMFAFLLMLYLLRVIYCRGFYVVTYVLGIHLLYHTLFAITPLGDNDLGGDGQLPHVAASADEEFRPFVPVMQEFVAWRSMTSAVVICLFLTLFPFMNIPVFWPILLAYFVFLTAAQMGGRIRHMIKHRYVPWNAGKPKFVPKN